MLDLYLYTSNDVLPDLLYSPGHLYDKSRAGTGSRFEVRPCQSSILSKPGTATPVLRTRKVHASVLNGNDAGATRTRERRVLFVSLFLVLLARGTHFVVQSTRLEQLNFEPDMPHDRPAYPPQPAQPPGKTYCQYSPDGQRLLVAGCANYARSFRTNDDDEPDVLDGIRDDTLALVVGDDYCILGTEDGAVCEYAVPSGQLKDILVRSTLPIRDIAIDPVGREWVAVCSDEVEVKLVNRLDIEKIHTLRDHTKPVKHVSYDPTGSYLAASCTDGKIYIYDVQNTSQPRLHNTVDGLIQRLDGADEATSKAVWHPLGGVFACASASREILVVNLQDSKIIARFSGGHDGKITSIAWSPNGALLASAAADDTLVVWDAEAQKILMKNRYERVLCCEWHPRGENLFSWTNGEGECFIIPGFLSKADHIELLNQPGRAGLGQVNPAQPQKQLQTNGHKTLVNGRGRARTPDSLDGYLNDADDEGWIEDDDGAGYKNINGKRAGGELNGDHAKRSRHYFEPEIHESFQPGATPWRGNRKYLCLNLTGFVWTVNNDTHNTVTVEFYDREMHRDFHFTDSFQYDKACLNEQGCLFACPPSHGQPATLFYRPHETWTNRADLRVLLPDGEDISCIALSNRYIVACTTANYVRVWTLFGTPYKVWRLKSTPAVTCAAHGDFLMTICNGPVDASVSTQLTYSIDNLRHDESCQSEDLVALGTLRQKSRLLVGDDGDDEEDVENVMLTTLFWTDTADPAIYDSTGTLLVLQHWRTPGQAKWVPILDTRQLSRLQDGKKQETYWPVAVADEKFHCIILKGGDQYPYFPRPLLTEFELEIPIGQPVKRKRVSTEDDNDDELDDPEETNTTMAQRLEESYVRTSLLLSLLDDAIQSRGDHASHHDKTEIARREIEVDKTLLQLLAVECREGEDRGMKALEIVSLMRDRGGKMIEAASKVAGRWGRNVLEEKIREMGERRFGGLDD